jgi:PAS domain S-box-containing protein
MGMEDEIPPAGRAPLLCWDLFLEGYYRKLDLAEDTKALGKLASKQRWKHAFDFHEQLFRYDKTVIVTDTALHIVYASSNMYVMNGYHPPEVIGKKPSIFQGPATSADTKEMIRNAIRELRPFEAKLINYRKSGELYDCHIKAFPVFNKPGALVNFIAFENVA